MLGATAAVPAAPAAVDAAGSFGIDSCEPNTTERLLEDELEAELEPDDGAVEGLRKMGLPCRVPAAVDDSAVVVVPCSGTYDGLAHTGIDGTGGVGGRCWLFGFDDEDEDESVL